MNASTLTTRLVAVSLLSSLPWLATTTELQAGPLRADQLPTISVSIGGTTPATWNYAPPIDSFDPANDANGGFELDSVPQFDIHGNRTHVEIRELQFDPDPFVLNNFLVTNNTAGTQLYSVFVGLPTTFGAPNVISGNVLTTVIDGGIDGATVATAAGQPIYQAQIDFAPVASLQNDPFSVSVPSGGANFAAASFGPSLSAIPVTANIGIQLRFTLTAGDTAAILSRFNVVPEPATLGLGAAAIGFLFGAARRARRR